MQNRAVRFGLASLLTLLTLRGNGAMMYMLWAMTYKLIDSVWSVERVVSSACCMQSRSLLRIVSREEKKSLEEVEERREMGNLGGN